jgi:hypothetical protein
LLQGYRAVNTNTWEFSAHRFLADSYRNLPRHEVARAAELLQSRLLQPAGALSLQPEFADDRTNAAKSGFLKGIGPSRLALNEFSGLYNRTGPSFAADLIAGSRRTFGDQLGVTYLSGTSAFGIGQFHLATDGFGDNTDIRKDAVDALIQSDLTTETSLQAEVRSSAFKRTQAFFTFDPFATNTRRFETGTTNFRLGGNHRFNERSGLIVSGIYQRSKEEFEVLGFDFREIARTRGVIGEAQYFLSSSRLNLVTGVGRFVGRTRFETADLTDLLSHTNAYAYSRWLAIPDVWEMQVGLSVDSLRLGSYSKTFTNPKFGVTWRPNPSTLLRAAVFRSVRRPLVANETIEPTQLGGFNQLFDDLNNTRATRYGLGVDQKVTNNIWVGGELSKRKLKTPLFLTVSETTDIASEERLNRVYAYMSLPPDRDRKFFPNLAFALTVDYQYETLRRSPELTGLEGILNVKTQTLPIGLGIFAANGASVRAVATRVRQRGVRLFFLGFDEFEARNDFWVTDLSLRYRLPRRSGDLILGIDNVLDRNFQFVETDPVNPRFVPHRFAYIRLLLNF